jgi:hypothetical protein
MIVVRRVDTPPDDSARRIVFETIADLDSMCGGKFSIWMSDDSCAHVIGTHTIIPRDGDDTAGAYMMLTAKDGEQMQYLARDEYGNMKLIDMDDPDAIERLRELGINVEDDAITAQGSRMFVMSPGCRPESAETSNEYRNSIIIREDDDNSTMVFVDENGVRHEIDLDAPDAEEQLASLGLDIEFVQSGDGTACCVLKSDGEGRSIIELQRPSGDEEENGEMMKETTPDELPDGFELNQNHPNPFNPTTDISFTLPEPHHVVMQVFNVRGQLVRTLIDADMSAGGHSVQWDSRDKNGRQVSSGVYFYRLTAGDVTATKKMTLLK